MASPRTPQADPAAPEAPQAQPTSTSTQAQSLPIPVLDAEEAAPVAGGVWRDASPLPASAASGGPAASTLAERAPRSPQDLPAGPAPEQQPVLPAVPSGSTPGSGGGGHASGPQGLDLVATMYSVSAGAAPPPHPAAGAADGSGLPCGEAGAAAPWPD